MTESIAQIKSQKPKSVEQNVTPPEAGNVWFTDDEPVDDMPLTFSERIFVITANVILSVVAVGATAFLAGVIVSKL